MSKHTPGPWKPYWYGGATTVGHAQDNFQRIAEITHTSKSDSEITANAKLIAAAPDLLEACRILADYYKGHEATDDQAAKYAGGGVYHALLAARAAIAKATT